MYGVSIARKIVRVYPLPKKEEVKLNVKLDDTNEEAKIYFFRGNSVHLYLISIIFFFPIQIEVKFTHFK